MARLGGNDGDTISMLQGDVSVNDRKRPAIPNVYKANVSLMWPTASL